MPTQACVRVYHHVSLSFSESTRRGADSLRCCTAMISRRGETSEEIKRTKQRTDDGPSRGHQHTTRSMTLKKNQKHGSPPRHRSCSHWWLCGLMINTFDLFRIIHTESAMSAISICEVTPSRLSRPLPRQKQHRTSHSLCWHHPHRNIQPHFLCSCWCIAEGVEHVQTAPAGKHVQRSPLDTPDKSDHCRFLARL